MKIILTPQGGPQSPYIKLLASALQETGVEISLARSHPLVLWRAVLDYGRPDLIHLQWQHPHFNAKGQLRAIWRAMWFYLQILSLKLIGIRFVWTIHNLVNHEKVNARWEMFTRRLLARLVDRLIVHCETAVTLVAKAYRINPARIEIAPMGHYGGYYPPPLPQSQARQQLNLPADQQLFLFFGQIRAYKGVEELLTAFTSLEGDNVQLLLAGLPKPASLGDALREQATADPRISSRFEYIPDEELITYLSACDLVVLPYRDFLTSAVAMLAMSNGRPILAPRLGCIRDFPAEAAIFYDPDQTDGLQQALRQALSAPLAEMGKAAKRYSLEFPWAETAVKTHAIYQSILPPGKHQQLLPGPAREAR